jgi:ribosome-associated protein
MTTEPAIEQLTPERLADLIAEAALDKKAQDVVALDLSGVSAFTDGFVIATGGSDRQVKAIHDGIHIALKNDHGLLPRRVEGLTESRWVLMDYWDVVIHIFTAEARDYYRLESLWGDVPKRAFEAGPEPDGDEPGSGADAA